jgi:transcriptional regulator with XRE-family HTH domain
MLDLRTDNPADIARATGINVAQVHRWLNGEAMSERSLWKIAEVYSLSGSYALAIIEQRRLRLKEETL